MANPYPTHCVWKVTVDHRPLDGDYGWMTWNSGHVVAETIEEAGEVALRYMKPGPNSSHVDDDLRVGSAERLMQVWR